MKGTVALTIFAIISGCVSVQGKSALLKLENRRRDTAQQLSFPEGSCQSVSFGPADRASVTPERPGRFAQAVLYPSLLQCRRRQGRIALISSDRGDVSIARQGRPVIVGGVRILVDKPRIF
ncbi:hypothetical protein K7432_000697 [Basidiobolus ranarum]|uniref:Lipoprotein n=1 Tax=Basidiobolus ranarum TaxID=34480 RepID=A0ABR2X477_9FUNG